MMAHVITALLRSVNARRSRPLTNWWFLPFLLSCSAYDNFTESAGDTAPLASCPKNCSLRGVCLDLGTCYCNFGWAGDSCSLECVGGAINPCSGHGVCQTDGACTCNEGYSGKSCGRRALPQDVNEYRRSVLGQRKGEILSPPENNTRPSQGGGTSGVREERGAVSGGSPSAKNEGKNMGFIKGVAISRAEMSSFGVNHASFALAAKALASNPESTGISSLLKEDGDKYWISPCRLSSGVKWIVIDLNEITLVHTIVIASFEYYSSKVNHFQVLGQLKYPTEHWSLLGQFQAEASRKYQVRASALPFR